MNGFVAGVVELHLQPQLRRRRRISNILPLRFTDAVCSRPGCARRSKVKTFFLASPHIMLRRIGQHDVWQYLPQRLNQ